MCGCIVERFGPWEVVSLTSEKRKREREWEKARQNFVPTPDMPNLPRPPPINFHGLQENKKPKPRKAKVRNEPRSG